MLDASLYRGVWPQNVNKVAKYAIRFVNGGWKITVLYEAGEGLLYLAVEGGDTGLADRINEVKTMFADSPGGAFYVNEFRHIVVPVANKSGSGPGSFCYRAGKLSSDLSFEFEGRPLTTKPIRPDGKPLRPGDSWVGPRPGVPYILAAGGGDIYYESPAITEDGSGVREGMTRRVVLSKVIRDKPALKAAVRPVAEIRGHTGGRFYVNEHGAMFTPVAAGDGNGLDYVYCGSIDLNNWFPEPETLRVSK